MDDWSFWDVLWTSLVFFVWITLVVIFVNVVIDVFRSRDLSGVKKAVWLVVLVVLPLIGMLVYTIARGDGMAERSVRAQLRQADQLRAAVGDQAGVAPSDQIASAKRLLEDGTITQEEFERLKARALA